MPIISTVTQETPVYARVQKIKRPNGQVDEYVQILESYRDHGKVRSRVISNLGNRRVLQSQALSLVKILKPSLLGSSESMEPVASAPYGITFLVHHLFSELNLWKALDSLTRAQGWADRVALLVTNRLSRPSSEHGLGAWLETQYVVSRSGKRYVPVWKERGRVKVDLKWLESFYRTLDILIEHKEVLEKVLYHQLRDLFHLKVEVVFYDVTSSYFEGEGPPEIARYGYNRDRTRRNRQILVGLVMVQGFPIAHHVFEGNLKDHETVETVIEDLEVRFGVGRIIFVGDRGMITQDVLSFIQDRQQGYLLGLPRRRREEVIRYIERIEGPGQECPVGINAGEKDPPPKTRVWEVRGETEGSRIFVVHSEEREAYEQAMRKRSMAQVKEELECLKAQVTSGKLKRPEKIGYHVAKILSRRKGHRYFDWRVSEQGGFEYFEHPVYLEQEKKIEGKYLIETKDKDLDSVEAVTEYKELAEVERGFRSLKDVVEMRPIYHQTEHRVRAHIFVAALGFLMERILEKKLKARGVNLSAKEALQALDTVSAVEFDTPSGKKSGITIGSAHARQVLGALGIDRAVLPNKTLRLPNPADVVAHRK